MSAGARPEEIVERSDQPHRATGGAGFGRTDAGRTGSFEYPRPSRRLPSKQIREHFRKFRIGSIDRVLERCDKRLRYFSAYRQQPMELQFNVGLRRGLEYYTGFLFEIYAKDLAAGRPRLRRRPIRQSARRTGRERVNSGGRIWHRARPSASGAAEDKRRCGGRDAGSAGADRRRWQQSRRGMHRRERRAAASRLRRPSLICRAGTSGAR